MLKSDKKQETRRGQAVSHPFSFLPTPAAHRYTTVFTSVTHTHPWRLHDDGRGRHGEGLQLRAGTGSVIPTSTAMLVQTATRSECSQSENGLHSDCSNSICASTRPCRAPQYNIVSCALRFTEEQQDKQQARATKIKNEVKRMAADYSKKMDDLVLEEGRELDQVWQKYAGESMEDDKSRRRLLNGLAENYVQIEVCRLAEGMMDSLTSTRQRIVNTLQASLLGFEKKRFEAAASTLDKAQKETNGNVAFFYHRLPDSPLSPLPSDSLSFVLTFFSCIDEHSIVF